jgi:hypothetical protein
MLFIDRIFLAELMRDVPCTRIIITVDLQLKHRTINVYPQGKEAGALRCVRLHVNICPRRAKGLQPTVAVRNCHPICDRLDQKLYMRVANPTLYGKILNYGLRVIPQEYVERQAHAVEI